MNIPRITSMRVIPFVLVLLLIPGCFAFTTSPITVTPSGAVYPGDPVNVSCTIYAASGVAFPSYDDLQFTTELDDPVWSYTIMVNGVENVRPAERGTFLTISGFELAYQNKDEVIVKIGLKAKVPASASVGTPRQFLKIQELDARSNVISSSVVTKDYLVGTPTPTPTPAFGSIAVTSRPAGANVYIDNVIRGITPLTLEGIPNGAHSVLVRQEGFSDYSESVAVIAGTAQVNAELVRNTATPATPSPAQGGSRSADGSVTAAIPVVPVTSSTGSLSVTTDPSGALVYIDGDSKGITPAIIPGLTAGNHTVLLIREGYQDFKTTTAIVPGTTSEFVTSLAKRKQVPGFSPAVAAVALLVVIAALHVRCRKE